ncbi:MAG TPA: protein translocase subunit SecF [Streptosporangiaceae bacterium]|nr:protein translocase subunit SecF [Streptosporangiaceae bacterium]
MASLGSIGGKLYRGEVSVEFVARQRLWYTISGVILVVSAVALIVFGLNFSVDFKGGSVYQFAAGNSTISQVRQTVSGAGGGDDAIVQKITPLGSGAAKWQVQTHPLTVKQQNSVQSAISQKFSVPDNQIAITAIGASWGSQISQKAAEALIAFLVVIVIYLSIAFEWKMAVAALIALAHDIVITIGVYALAHFQVSPASVIGLLTILGYSLYDTVVVFDKVRENTAGLLASSRSTYSQAANQALNQTLVRSINTSVIALLPVASILFVGAGVLGAGELKDLALVLFVGMLSGTYSSICIATPVLADLKEREPQYKALAKRVQLRASGGRAAQRAKAAAGAKPVAARRGRKPAGGPQDAGMAAAGPQDTEPDVTDQTAGEAADTDAVASGEPVGAAASQPSARGGPRPGPRQQPRRTSAAKRRPSGKKRRR